MKIAVGRARHSSAPVLALDLGASRIRAAVVGADGTPLARTEGATPAAEGPAAVRARCIALLREVRADALRAGAAPVEVIGISAPGPLDPRSGRLVEPPNLGPAFRDVASAGRWSTMTASSAARTAPAAS